MPRRELSVAHRTWIVDNLTRGVAIDDIVAGLAELPAARARREVHALAGSPLLPIVASLARRARQLELVAALGRAHARSEPDASQIERRPTVTADELFRHYFASQRPVVLTAFTATWPALRKWTPAFFRRRFGDVSVEVTAGREADPRYDQNQRQLRRRMRMDRFIDRVLELGTSNDLYLVANNRTMRRAVFAPLLKDVRAPAAIFHPLQGGTTSLWIGPGGTRTPLHHDTTNILFCQIYGRKHFDLVSPQETALLATANDGFYHPIDLDTVGGAAHPALRAMTIKRVTLGPGDALFLPAGWWHRVTALDVSISFSLLGFRRPNNYDWYRPGSI